VVQAQAAEVHLAAQEAVEVGHLGNLSFTLLSLSFCLMFYTYSQD
jgi:hypothetical protein